MQGKNARSWEAIHVLVNQALRDVSLDNEDIMVNVDTNNIAMMVEMRHKDIVKAFSITICFWEKTFNRILLTVLDGTPMGKCEEFKGLAWQCFLYRTMRHLARDCPKKI